MADPFGSRCCESDSKLEFAIIEERAGACLPLFFFVRAVFRGLFGKGEWTSACKDSDTGLTPQRENAELTRRPRNRTTLDSIPVRVRATQKPHCPGVWVLDFGWGGWFWSPVAPSLPPWFRGGPGVGYGLGGGMVGEAGAEIPLWRSG